MVLGFSFPISQFSAALARFFTPELTDSLWFGAQVSASPGPLVVTSVQPAGPAATAGLREGDHILQINGQTAKGIIAFNRLLRAGPDQSVKLLVSRDGERRTLTVQLVAFDQMIRQKLGLRVVD